jgi:hypothetical protein
VFAGIAGNRARLARTLAASKTPMVVAAIRASTPEDGPAIVELLTGAGLRANVRPSDLHWKYWRAGVVWAGPRSFVLARGRELIAHAAIVPGMYAWGSEKVTTIHMIDWVARRDAIGAGAGLMKHIRLKAQALLAIGGSADTLRILPQLGFRTTGVATGFVRTLAPLRLLWGVEKPTWRLLPRVVRSAAWTMLAPTARSSEWRSRRLFENDLQALEGLLPLPARGMAVTERTIPQLCELIGCPIVPISCYSVEKSGCLQGYFLLASAAGQVRVADCWINSDKQEDWRELILCAVERAKEDTQAAEVVIWASDPLLQAVLADCGFHARSRLPIQVLAATESSIPPVPLRVQMLDTDAAWMHWGRNEYAA